MKVSTPGDQFLCKTCAKVCMTYLVFGVLILVFSFQFLREHFSVFWISCIVYITCNLISVNKIKALLWHMQEDLESFRQWKLGEESYKTCFSYEFMIIIPICR